MKEIIEKSLEKAMFASRWLLAPIYITLALSLGLITIKVFQEFLHFLPTLNIMKSKELMLYLLHVVDLALLGNLLLMIIFAGYENFVSKILVAEHDVDKPSWMGKVDFSELKLKLIASIVAISGINLLETFMDVESVPDREIMWMVIIHVMFIVSGLLLALMDLVAAKSKGVSPEH